MEATQPKYLQQPKSPGQNVYNSQNHPAKMFTTAKTTQPKYLQRPKSPSKKICASRNYPGQKIYQKHHAKASQPKPPSQNKCYSQNHPAEISVPDEATPNPPKDAVMSV